MNIAYRAIPYYAFLHVKGRIIFSSDNFLMYTFLSKNEFWPPIRTYT